MPQREFTLQVRHNAEGDKKQVDEAFAIVAQILRRSAQEIYAKLLLLGGSTKPEIMLLADDMIEGLQQMDVRASGEPTVTSDASDEAERL